jgi:hypothetical protein
VHFDGTVHHWIVLVLIRVRLSDTAAEAGENSVAEDNAVRWRPINEALKSIRVIVEYHFPV